MAQISPREVATAIAIAGLIQRPRIAGEFGALNTEFPLRRKKRAVSSVASRKDAIEQIKTGANSPHDILRSTYTHKIAWPRFGQQSRRRCCDGVKYLLPFTHAQAAHSKAVEGHRIHLPNTLL